MPNFYVTFSDCGNQHFKGGHSLIYANDMMEARDKAFDAYGPKFFTVYSQDQWEANKARGVIGFNSKLNEIIE